MKFIISIDTEGDNQWDHGRELTTENIKFVPRFQDLCVKFGIKPTYLVTSEICENPFAREIFSDYIVKNQAEVGAHLHSWTTPPFIDKVGYRFNDPNHAFANELPDSMVSEKIKYLTGQIETSFGKRPLSFRSGRYGFNENVARILTDNAYLVDSSVTPYSSWSLNKGLPGGKGGPDFVDETPYPYNFNFSNGSLLEIPITILPTRFPLNRRNKLSQYYFRNVDNSIPLRVFRKLFYKQQPLWLRPMPGMNIGLFDELLSESVNIKLPCIVMMFHSSELMPGCSIYRHNEKSIDELYDLLENLFINLRNRNINSVTLTEAAIDLKNESMFLG